MNFLKQAGRKLGQTLGLDFVNPNTMFYPDQWRGDSETEEGGQRKGVYTDAFWLAPPYGRPRQIDYERLEPLENSIWVRMCVQHIVDSIAGAEWTVGPRRHGEDVSEELLTEMREFFESDAWGESWGQIARQCLPDLVNYDAGVLNKVFPVVSYNTEGELKPNAKPLELVALDGRSMMKDVGLFKNLKGYYQYSWINPQGIPIHFEKEEIIYLQQSPSPREPYGTSSLEVIESVLDYMMDSTLAQSKYWKNGLFIGGQIDLPEVKDINELKRMQAYFEAKLRGPRKYNKWLITGGGAKVQSLPFTSQQMQWLDSQKWFAKMVFAIYKLTPSELGFTEDLNRATGIQQMEIHKSKGVRPILKILEEAINREIIWRHFSPDISYSYTQELSLDEKKLQSDIDAARLSNNLDSVNELRDRDGKEKWPGEQYDGPNSDAETEEPEDDFNWDDMFAEGGESGEEENPEDEEDVKKGGEGSGIKGHTTNRFGDLKSWTKSLNKDETNAINSWMRNGYKWLREADRAGEESQQLNHLKSALRTAPLYSGAVSRGIRMNLNLKVGDNLSMNALSSFSTNPAVAKALAVETPEGKSLPPSSRFTILRIEDHRGAVRLPMESVAGTYETEVLMEKGRSFEVIGVENHTIKRPSPRRGKPPRQYKGKILTLREVE